MVNIFNYTNAREFLADAYRDRKASDARFSHRFIAREMGQKSQGWFAQIVSGDKRIRADMVRGFARLLGMDRAQVDHFRLLVARENARSPEEKSLLDERIRSSMDIRLRELTTDSLRYFQEWYHTPIRALAGITQIKKNYGEIGKLVDPPIDAFEARTSVELLIKLGILERNTEGVVRITDEHITAEGDEGIEARIAFTKTMLDLGKRALDEFERDQRQASTVTVGVSENGYHKIVDALAKCRRTIQEIVNSDSDIDRVLHMSFLLFPLSKVPIPKEIRKPRRKRRGQKK